MFPIVVSLFFRDWELTSRLVILLVPMILLSYFGRKISIPYEIQTNEAMVIASLAFILIAFLFSFIFWQKNVSYLDALFESISAITTTGLSTLKHEKDFTPSLLVIRAWLQWIGGLGIIVISIAFSPFQSKLNKEVLVDYENRKNSNYSEHNYAKWVLYFYLSISILALLVLFGISDSFFDALIFSMTSISTGGFPADSEGLKKFGRNFQFAITAFSLMGAISFPLLYLNSYKKIKKLFANNELRSLIVLVLLCSFILMNTKLLQTQDSLNIYDIIMLSVSAQTTTGFSSLNVSDLTPISILILTIVMFIGGSSSSTAGGFKLNRFVYILKGVKSFLRKEIAPKHAVGEMNQEEKEQLLKVSLLFFIYISVLVTSWLVFVLYGYDTILSLFEVTSAFGTVGLSTGISEESLEIVPKIILCLNMLLGRLEVIAIIILFYPKTWIGKRKEYNL
ncbi:MAG: TrkH family potassium uptake protein [Bdellovibrionales bacterium]|nr:TrkH family potassium uptake protein [Bdellovibrionales bacterium]